MAATFSLCQVWEGSFVKFVLLLVEVAAKPASLRGSSGRFRAVPLAKTFSCQAGSWQRWCAPWEVR